MKIKSWLPMFPGFYSTIFESDEDSIIDQFELKNDHNIYDFINYGEYENDVSKKCCSILEDLLSNFVSKIEFEYLYSPREYNFRNDEINCRYFLNKNNIDNIRQYLTDNKNNFNDYIENKFTSRSGFISFYSNDSQIWLDEFLNNDFDLIEDITTKFGSILDFVCLNEYISQDYLFDSIEINISSYFDIYGYQDSIMGKLKEYDHLLNNITMIDFDEDNNINCIYEFVNSHNLKSKIRFKLDIDFRNKTYDINFIDQIGFNDNDKKENLINQLNNFFNEVDF